MIHVRVKESYKKMYCYDCKFCKGKEGRFLLKKNFLDHIKIKHFHELYNIKEIKNNAIIK